MVAPATKAIIVKTSNKAVGITALVVFSCDTLVLGVVVVVSVRGLVAVVVVLVS